jgi:hypothetical protein
MIADCQLMIDDSRVKSAIDNRKCDEGFCSDEQQTGPCRLYQKGVESD